MLTKRAPDVSVTNVEAGIPSGSTIGIVVTSVLLETWCATELQWVVYERRPPRIRLPARPLCRSESPSPLCC